eukprot:6459404-Amphidinium_carterae.1
MASASTIPPRFITLPLMGFELVSFFQVLLPGANLSYLNVFKEHVHSHMDEAGFRTSRTRPPMNNTKQVAVAILAQERGYLESLWIR